MRIYTEKFSGINSPKRSQNTRWKREICQKRIAGRRRMRNGESTRGGLAEMPRGNGGTGGVTGERRKRSNGRRDLALLLVEPPCGSVPEIDLRMRGVLSGGGPDTGGEGWGWR